MKVKNKFKSGQLVMFKTGDEQVYSIHTIYSPRKVSLGLHDWPEVEQDSMTNTSQLKSVTIEDLIRELKRGQAGRYFERDMGCEDYIESHNDCCGMCAHDVFLKDEFIKDITKLL